MLQRKKEGAPDPEMSPPPKRGDAPSVTSTTRVQPPQLVDARHDDADLFAGRFALTNSAFTQSPRSASPTITPRRGDQEQQQQQPQKQLAIEAPGQGDDDEQPLGGDLCRLFRAETWCEADRRAVARVLNAEGLNCMMLNPNVQLGRWCSPSFVYVVAVGVVDLK